MSIARLPVLELLRRTGAVVLDPAVLLFAALVAFLISAGLRATASVVLLVPGLLMLIFATSALFKYTTIVARALALGRQLPSAESAVFEYFREPWAFAPWMAFLLYNAAVLLVWHYLGNLPAVVLLVLSLPLLPAALGAIVVEQSVLALARPGRVLGIARGLGIDYLKVLGLWVGAALVAALLRHDAGVVTGMLAVLVGVLQVFVLFAATGITMYHHHAALGIPGARAPVAQRREEQAAAMLVQERRVALDQSYGFFSRDNALGGLQRIKVYLDTHPDDAGAWAWFMDEMRQWENPQPALLLARNYLAELLAQGDQRGALRLLLWCLRRDERFMPHPEQRAEALALLDGYPEAERAARWPGQAG